MTSPAWLEQGAQSSASQLSISSSSVGGPSDSVPAANADSSLPASTAAPPVLPTAVAAHAGPKVNDGERNQDSNQANTQGYVNAAPALYHGVRPAAGNGSANSQNSSSSSVPQSTTNAAVVVQTPAPGLSPPVAPSFSYNVVNGVGGFPNGQQFNNKTASSVTVIHEVGSASSLTHSAAMPAHTPYSTTAASTSLVGPPTLWVPPALPFPVAPGTPGTPAPPGVSPSRPVLPHLIVPSAPPDSFSVTRPNLTSASIQSDPSNQQPMYPSHPSLPHATSAPQGLWLQPPQVGGMQRPPFLPYPGVFRGPFPLMARGMPLPSVPVPDSQPSNVTPLGNVSDNMVSSLHSSHQLAHNSGPQPDLPPPGTDSIKRVDRISSLDQVAVHVHEKSDAWTAHKTDTGAVYYYNALTGESTYEKPVGFKGQTEEVMVQPTPVSWDKLVGTDWASVTTNDGKRYYYNTKTKLSSWQIPSEIAELRKKQDTSSTNEPKGYSGPMLDANLSTEKGSLQISLTAPAITTGGRDATSVKASGGLGSTSALDLIKKKLQESGSPVTSSTVPASPGQASVELNGSRAADSAIKSVQSETNRDKVKDANGDGNSSDSSSDSEDEGGATKEEQVSQFKEMLKERRIAPFSKWDKELPKILFDPRFKAIPSYSMRRSLFEHYVKTRAEEERKEKRAAQKAAIEHFKKLLEEASEEIDHTTDYHTFKRKWGDDPRFFSLERKERELLLNERVLPLKKAAEEKARALRAASASSFKSLLRDKEDLTVNSRWSRVKDSLKNDPRYKSVKHEDRETLFNEYIAELKATAEAAEQRANAKKEEQEKLRERERLLRKRKEREEQEVERVRLKVRRKEALASFQTLLVETIKDPQASWTESKPKLEKDPQGRATTADIDSSDFEKLFRDHIKMLNERCGQQFKALLSEVLNTDAAARETEDGKTALTSWSTAKRLLKTDPRYSKMPRKDRESLWRRYVDETQQKIKSASEDRHLETKGRSSIDSTRLSSASRRGHERR